MVKSLTSWFGRLRGNSEVSGGAVSSHRRGTRESSSQPRASSALREFFEGIRDQIGLNIIDFSGACQENVTFITGLRHRLYAESFPRAVDAVFGANADAAQLRSPERIDAFLQYSLNFEPESVDAILLWDGLEWLEPDGQRAVVNRIFEILRPNGMVFAVFHTESAVPAVPIHFFRVQDPETLVVTDTGMDRSHRLFSNRSVEKLFERFQSVKFFLSRDKVREVIVRR